MSIENENENEPHICDVVCPGCGEPTYCITHDLCEKCEYSSAGRE